MKSRKLFTCQQCDANMEVEAPQNHDRVTCTQCGRLYRLQFSDGDNAWHLQAEEPAEEAAEKQRREEEPFSVLAEEGRPKKVDRAEQHREQSDLHADEDIAIDKRHRES